MNSFVQLLHDFISESGKALEPTIVFLRQHVHDLQEVRVVFLGLVLGKLCQSLVDVTCLSSQLLTQRKRVFQRYDFQKVLEVQLALLAVNKNTFP